MRQLEKGKNCVAAWYVSPICQACSTFYCIFASSDITMLLTQGTSTSIINSVAAKGCYPTMTGSSLRIMTKPHS